MASFSISESPILPRVQSTNSSPRSASSRDWEEFSSALLEDGFVLTALELHTELLECGKEVPSLRDYFSNPGNFEHAIPQPPSGILHSSMSEICYMSVGGDTLGFRQCTRLLMQLLWYGLVDAKCLAWVGCTDTDWYMCIDQ